MKTSLEYEGDSAVIKLGVDSKEWYPHIQNYALEIIKKKLKKVEVDFKRVEYFNSGGVANLIFVYRQLLKNNVDVVNYNMSKKQKNNAVIRLTKYLIEFNKDAKPDKESLDDLVEKA